ncbi:PAS domain-containing protein [Aureispira]|nr:PAS domain-containing protein [Aureispira sp.]
MGQGQHIQAKLHERILIASVRKDKLAFLHGILSEQSFIIDQVNSGNEALRKCLNYDYDLFLIDKEVSDMDGFQLAGLLKDSMRTMHVPVIYIINSDSDMSFYRPNNNFCADDFIYLPIDAVKLKLKVNTCIQLFNQYKQLNESKNEIKAILRAMPDCIMEVQGTLDLIKIYVNKEHFLLGKVRGAEKSLYDFLKKSTCKRIEKSVSKVLDYSGLEIVEFNVKEPNQSTKVFYEARIVQNTYCSALIVFRDITELRKVEFLLKEQNSFLQKQNKSLENAYNEIESVSRFPSENPHPVLRVANDNIIQFANESALSKLLKHDNINIGDEIPEKYNFLLNEASSEMGVVEQVIEMNNMIFSISAIKIPNRNYINFYAVDITKSKNEIQKREKQLEIDKQRILNVFEAFNEAQHMAKIGSWEYNVLKDEMSFSSEYYNILEIGEKNDKPLYDVLIEKIHPSDIILYENLFFTNDQKLDNFSFEHRIICNDGSIKYIWCKGVYINDDSGNVVSLKGTAQDITQRKKYEKEIAYNELLINELMSNINEVVFSVQIGDENKIDNALTYINGNTKYVFGYSKEDFLTSQVIWSERIHPDDKKRITNLTRKLVESDTQLVREYRFCHKDGHYVWLEDNVSVALSEDGKTKKMFGCVRDISERKNAEILLVSNEEKSILLKEIHHRVKNNLQVITSLLSLQSSYLLNEEQKNIFSDSQYRINSMAIVHEMLYQSDNLSKLNYFTYLHELGSFLITSMKGPSNNIDLILNVDNISLSIDTAVPLGLLINEIITNSLKYGIKENTEGAISISINKHFSSKDDDLDNSVFHMVIGDNGAGYSDKINFDNTKSLGMKLIKSLTRQLNGTISKDNSKAGTYYNILFTEIQ